jgi:hypothetical protein
LRFFAFGAVYGHQWSKNGHGFGVRDQRKWRMASGFSGFMVIWSLFFLS